MESIWGQFLNESIQQSFYNVKGIQTRAIESGNGHPLIFLHGANGHAETFSRNIIPHSDSFHVYSIDMVGHGSSDAPDHLEYSLPDFIDHLNRFINAIGAEQVHLSGQSIGAYVALGYAHKYPERVNRLCMTTGFPATLSQKGYEQFKDVLQRTETAADDMTRESVRDRLEWLMFDSEVVTEELVEIRYALWSQPGRSKTIRTIQRSVVGGRIEAYENGDSNEWARYQDENFLNSIQPETLVIWTTGNRGQAWEDVKASVSNLPQHKTYMMEEASHWPQWEKPEEYNRVHKEFLLNGL